MQTLQDAARDKTAEAFTAHLTLIVNDAQAWVNLFTEDAVVEFAYAAALCSLKRLLLSARFYNALGSQGWQDRSR